MYAKIDALYSTSLICQAASLRPQTIDSDCEVNLKSVECES